MNFLGFLSSYEWHAGSKLMFYAYIIQSEPYPRQLYVGFTRDLKARLSDHNSGSNRSTRTGRPWKLAFYAAFERKQEAVAFETYLKTASGKAFARKRLLPG